MSKQQIAYSEGDLMLGEARFVDIGDRSLYTRVSGTGPTVILNSGAGREGVGSWSIIETRLSEFATVITYDRGGLGQSESIDMLPSALDRVEELERLLNALSVSKPLVLVGASLSGLLVQLYACQHPQDVAGLLLLDPTPDEFLAAFPNLPPATQDTMRKAMVENAKKTGASEAAIWETQKIFESCEQVRRAVVDERRMPNVEFVVVTACMPVQVLGKALGGATPTSALTHAHRRMAERVALGRHLLAEHSSHNTILSTEVDLIVEIVRSMIS